MVQLTLDIPEVKIQGRFSFALWAYDTNTSFYGRKWRAHRARDGLCIVFGPPHNAPAVNDVDYLRQVMDAPFIPTLVNPNGPIWFEQLRKHIVVTEQMSFLRRVSKGAMGQGIGLLEKKNGKWEKTVWEYFDLYKHCFNLEKVASNCVDCVENNRGCFLYTATSMCNEQGLPVPVFPPEEEDSEPVIDTMETEDIGAFCTAVSKGTRWEYVSPRDANDDPFSPMLLNIEELEFHHVEANREKRHDTAVKSAATRKAVKICEKECCYHQYCSLSTKPYNGIPQECQAGSSYVSLSVGGPYTEEQFNDSFKQFWDCLPHIDRRKVELIAQNGGLITNLYGRELMLQRMSEDMDAVDFLWVGSGDTLRVDFEEAVLLCTTPFFSGKKYVYPGWEDAGPMPDELFHTYVEICQHDETLQGGWGFSNSYPIIREVEWCGYSIRFDTNKSWCSGRCMGVFEFVSRYARGTFPKTAKHIRLQEEAEMVHQETSLNMQL